MRRLVPGLLAMIVLAIGTLLPAPALAASTTAPGDPLCSVEEWQNLGIMNFDQCLNNLQEVAAARAQCLTAPNPATPDAGFAGWFATKPTWNFKEGLKTGRYSSFGYAGYDYTTYDIGCASTLMHPDYKFENTIANGEFMIAGGIVAAANGLRERAWDPGTLWSWADPLVEKATQGIYSKVFSVFGLVTLAVIGIYLMWRARRAEMSAAVTTVGWALVVMVAVTAIAKWPVASANVADSALTETLGVVHDAIGPSSPVVPRCAGKEDQPSCQDYRPPAVRAGDTAVQTLLYRNWLRGLLGSADSDTAKKYGPALYEAKSLTWFDLESLDAISDPVKRQVDRDVLLNKKKAQWMRVAEQIKTEDPQAYEYLQGTKGMERIGAGFVAILSSLAYALFDIVASLLVLLGFLIFRWAVIAAPALGTVGMLRPASAGIRRLAGAVLAAVFNIAIFGTGAAVYLSAVDMIMGTPSLPGWLQVTLVLLCGVVGWILLRPYRRITQLGGATPAQGWGRELLRPSTPGAASSTRTVTARTESRTEGRPEVQVETELEIEVREPALMPRTEGLPEQRRWSAADVPDGTPAQVLYRPGSGAGSDTAVPRRADAQRSEGVVEEAPSRPVVRAEAL